AKNKNNTATVNTVVSTEVDIVLKSKPLVKAYRSYGYKSANIYPLGLTRFERESDLEFAAHGLSEKDQTQLVNLSDFTDK
ncbi:hypothetical protein, partial [Francisella tularensis]|uniref:hypothetical protein n=1 Tax=Francisella tularensis TaxID=263 RepID=UPI002381C90B